MQPNQRAAELAGRGCRTGAWGMNLGTPKIVCVFFFFLGGGGGPHKKGHSILGSIHGFIEG